MQTSVLIIGSGVSGLSAARCLHQNGWLNVKILEAGNYFGGRTKTHTFEKLSMDLGAQWIHGQIGNSVYELAKLNDLVDDDAPSFISSIFSFPQLTTAEEKEAANDVCMLFRKMLEDNGLNATPLKSLDHVLRDGFDTYLQKSTLPLKLKNLMKSVFDWNVRFECSINGCQSLDDVSSLLLNNYEECEGNRVTELRNKYSSFVNVLKDSIPQDWIQLNSEVKVIKWNTDEAMSAVLVTTSDGAVHEADHVIVTVPLSYLKSNMMTMFDPQLPKVKQDAINAMGFGTVNKVFLFYEEPFWKNGDVINVLWLDEDLREENDVAVYQESNSEGTWIRDLINFTYVHNQPQLLCAWLSGKGAKDMELFPLEEVGQACHKLLCKILSNSELVSPKQTFRSSWCQNKYFGGSYSYLSVACEKKNLGPDDIAQPITSLRNGTKEYPFLLFAGEATHNHFFSTVHGAYDSGVREADRLTMFYKKSICWVTRNALLPSVRKKPKVVIIGAGVAGLAAANKLTQEYSIDDVLILEVSDRIGGRILTVPYGKGVLELGAQWVHGEEGNPLYSYALVKQLLSDPLVDYSVEGTGHFVDSNGQYLDKDLVNQVIMALDSIKEDLYYNRESSESVGSFFLRRFQEYLESCDDLESRDVKVGLYDWYMRFEVIDNSCNSLEHLSIDGFCEWTDCPGVSLINFKSGFSTLVDSLSVDLPKKCVCKSSPVTRVEWNRVERDWPAIVYCADGQTFPADHVIVTPSIGFLKEHWDTFFSPLLPVSRKRVLDSFGFATVNKMYLIFKEKFWNDDDLGFQLIWTSANPQLNKLAVEHPWIRDISGFDTVRGQKETLVGWIGGSGAVAVEAELDDVVITVCASLLRIFTNRPELDPPIRLFRSKWHEDIYTRGAYSHRLNTYRQQDSCLISLPIYVKQEKRISDPWPVLLFAGEATDAEYFSSVHGALRSGWREAERIYRFWRDMPEV